MCWTSLTVSLAMLVDANLLLYAVDEDSPFNESASEWLTGVLNGDRRVGIPWQSIGAFVRIISHPRVTSSPLNAEAAWGHVSRWLDSDPTWIPPATERTASVFGRLLASSSATGNLIPDAQLAALSIEHGLQVMTVDTDFARFPGVSFVNPLV